MKNIKNKVYVLGVFLFFLFNSTIKLQAQTETLIKLDVDTAACYIVESFFSSDWGNTTIEPGNGGVATASLGGKNWLGKSSPVRINAHKMNKIATLNGNSLQFIVQQARAGNYNNHLGMLNLKNLFGTGEFNASHVTSSLELPTLPTVGKFILFIKSPYGSMSEGIIVEKKLENGTWEEVLQFKNPATDRYVFLHELSNGKIISESPVTYRLRSYSYNTSTSAGYGPIIGALIVEKHKKDTTSDLTPVVPRPYYPMKESNAVSKADILLNTYTEEKWLNLVPEQAPRSLQYSPADPLSCEWIWSASNPDQIICKSTGTVFPNDVYTKYERVTTVLSGKTIKVPYYKASTGRLCLFQALIDYYKTSFMSKNLPIIATAYQQTKNEKYARYVALALDKWANAVPDYFMTKGWNGTTIMDVKDLPNNATCQRASDHNGFTHEFHDGEILAFDRIFNSQALKELSVEKGYDVRKHISNDLFLNIALWLKDRPLEAHASTNLVGHIGVMIKVAAVIEDEQKKTELLNFVDKYYTMVIERNYKRDGMYPESFGYHRGYVIENNDNIKLLENYFELFEPQTEEMKVIAEKSTFRKAFNKQTTEVHHMVAFPNGDLAPFDDTPSGMGRTRNVTQSYLLPAYGHAMLGDGIGEQQIQSNIGANDYCNHVGFSMMSMTLYANGEEQIGDIRYSRIPGRKFTNSVLAHNLVAIDEERTQYKSTKQGYGNSGHVFNNGYFSLFEPGKDGVAATEVYSNYINPGKVKRYQRLHILNTMDLSRPYLIDLFVVNGGTKHDYILNGSTQFDQQVESSLKMTALPAQYPLLPAGATYKDPIKEDDDTNWWGAFREMSTAPSTGYWHVSFMQNAESGIRIHSLDNEKADIYLGKSPVSYRRTTATTMYDYWRPALIERRKVTNGETSLFIHVIEAYKNGSFIQSVTSIPLKEASDEYIGLSVKFNTGREDIIIVNLNSKLITGVEPTATIHTADGSIALTGKIGVVSRIENETRAVLISGKTLEVDGEKVETENGPYYGTISGTVRLVDGANCNALITDTMIPEGDALKGKWMQVQFGVYNVISPSSSIRTQEGMNELFQIDHVKRENNRTYIVTTNDHYLHVNGAFTTELMRPQRTFNGNTTFRIYDSKSFFSNPTGVQKKNVLQTVRLYPNPAKDFFIIQSSQNINEYTIRNLSGIVVSHSAKNVGNTIHISNLQLDKGVYLVTIVLESGELQTERLIIN